MTRLFSNTKRVLTVGAIVAYGILPCAILLGKSAAFRSTDVNAPVQAPAPSSLAKTGLQVLLKHYSLEQE